MVKKNGNFLKLTFLGIFSILIFSGCGITEMSDAQMNVIADYAADVLVRYDASYYDRFAKEKKKEEEETVTASKETDTPNTEPVETEEPVEVQEPEQTAQLPAETVTPVDEVNAEVSSKMSPREIGEIFGFQDIEISYSGFQELQKYPDAADNQLAFQLEASENHKLYVFSFNIFNPAQEAKNCNFIGQNIKMRVRVNDTENLTVQKTLLLDDLAQMNTVLQPTEGKTAVVVCQVPSDYNVEISSLSLIVRIGGEDHEIKLQ